MPRKNKPDSIQLDPKNANKGTKRGRSLLEKSLKNYGAGRSILIDKNRIAIAGNKTLEEARKQGFKVKIVKTDGKELIAVQRTDLDLAKDKKAKELAVADNRVSELDLEWDGDMLGSLEIDLGELDFRDSDMKRLGIEVEEETAPEPKLDQAAELQKKWKTARGQMWSIGKHRLMCGDSLSDDVSLLMMKEEAAMCFTDPPWNVAIGGDGNPRHRQRKGLSNDSMSQEDFGKFLESVGKTIVSYTTGDVYCVMGCEQWPSIDAALRRAGMHWSATVIWVKDIFVLGRSKYHRRYEPLWYGWPVAGKSTFSGARDLDDVWEIPRPRNSEEHPTMKPVELYRRAIINSSAPRAIVFDPFAGSGTIFVAAEQSGREARGCDIDPGFVAVALERMSDMGLKPKLL